MGYYSEERDRGFTCAVDAELMIQQRNSIKLTEWQVKYRTIRYAVYNFLDHPMSSRSTGYHFTVFLFVLSAVILGATTDTDDHAWMLRTYSWMEIVLGVFFCVEFAVRMWAISADAKYKGWKGHVRYLTRLVCIVDIIIILVTIFILFAGKANLSSTTMDLLRLIQILRLFHIDRQMTTWRLIKDMVMISRWELFSAYYITFIIVLLLTNIVYYTEYISNPIEASNNITDGQSETFPTLAHAWWFSIVTVLTIGYGDIVPLSSISRLIVCILGFLAFCTFVTASTQISVGLTLMMEEDNKKEYKKKIRNTAASVIQCWWRYHLATQLFRANTKCTKHFRHVCFKLYLTEERMNRIQQLEKRIKEKKERKRTHRAGRERSNCVNGIPVQAATITAGEQWRGGLASLTSQIMKPAGIPNWSKNRSLGLIKRSSLQGNEMFQSVPQSDTIPYLPPFERLSLFTRRHSTDTTISSSFDCSDGESQPYIDENERPSIDINDIDQKLLNKYQPLLRFLNFLLFRKLMQKFQRLRKADRLMEIEAEIIEQEHEREQKLRELEDRLNGIIGKATLSPLDNSGEKLSIKQRIDLCEDKMTDMEKKVDTIDMLVQKISGLVLQLDGSGQRKERPRSSYEMRDINEAEVGTMAPQQRTPALLGLPPTPPGRRIKLMRQCTVTTMAEEPQES